MEQKEIKIDKNVLAPEDFENTKLINREFSECRINDGIIYICNLFDSYFTTIYLNLNI